MAKLVFSLDGNLLGEYSLDKPLLRIGRRRDNDIAIDNLMISGEHAQVMCIGQHALLQDLDSTNGTMLNGVRVKQQVLQHGDIIMLGHYQLRYWDEAGYSGDHSLTDAVVVSLEEPGARLFSQELPSEDTAAIAGKFFGRLYVISGPDFGKDILLNQAVITIGGAGLPVAIILQEGPDYLIQALDGGESLTVNGSPLANSIGGHMGQRLQDHDLIAYAGVKMEFYLTADENQR
ncbi:FHA domain-containing protein [Methylovorus menthalis]|uniref:FHA domain-containing protein n=1 Tax=Methylovorus menthalis TaxID=1002227 RepID=UPI001E4FBE0D|nr:FHA domain-containing protein [Methylovorus menthalis]MCB4810994.1 FHA domain-containing protein [Methylovorus menthalis]